VLLGTGIYLIWRAKQIRDQYRIDVPLKTEAPAGSRPTGRTQRTTNSAEPGDTTERLSYGVREWVEVLLPDGTLDWLEVDRTKLVG
jgi:hypothetical protein